MMGNFSENLKKLRKRKRVYQKDAAEELGISCRTYQTYEYGEREPSIAGLIKLADYYDVTLDELVGREGKKDAP